MEVYDAIRSRRAIRSFTGQAVERSVIERLIAAAAAAPSQFNRQPWHFHVTTGETREALGHVMALSTVHLEEYLDLIPDSKEGAERFFASLGDAPVVIAISCKCDDDPYFARGIPIAVGCAVENLMLAATAEGLGTCCVTFSYWVRDKLAELLDVPEGHEVLSLVLLGHACDTPEPLPRREDVATYRD